MVRNGHRYGWLALDPDGRGERIRTSDPLHPMQVRYQAAPRPEYGS